MRFLVDECVSPRVAVGLAAGGHEAAHVRDLRLAGEDDEAVVARARADGSVVITSDHDFGKIMFRRGYVRPSIIFLRDDAPGTASAVVRLLLSNLDTISEALDAGAIVSIDATRMRVRRLPVVG